MAIRYNGTTKFGDLDVIDNEGRGHIAKFGGPGTGGRTKTDVELWQDAGGPLPLKLLFPNLAQANITTTADKVTFTSTAVDVELYLGAGDEGSPNVLNFDALLKTRAAANAAASVTFNLGNDNLYDFVPLTPLPVVSTEIRRGKVWVCDYNVANRPTEYGTCRLETLQGGYHVRYKNFTNHRQNRNYCQIGRPKLIDALGNESWGAVLYNATAHTLTYTFDAAFLASAPLPIRVDPTFGDTTAGTDTFDMADGRILTGIFSNPDSGVTLTKLTAYVDNSGTVNNKGVYFAVSAGVPTSTPLGIGAATSIPAAPAWTDFDMGDQSLSVTDYALGLVADIFWGVWYKDASGGNDSHMDNANSYSSPGTWTETSAYGGQMNIYATTAAAGGTVITRSLSDSVTVVSSMGPTRSRTRLASESVSVSDSVGAVKYRVRLISEYVSAVDDIVRGVVRNMRLEEAVSVADTLMRVLSVSRTMTEAITATDQLYRTISLTRNLSDSLVVLDSLASTVYQGAGLITKVLTEAIEVSDSNSRYILLVRAYTEAVAVSDYASRFIELNRLLADSATVSDTLAQSSKNIVRALNESVTALDSLLRTVSVTRELNEYVDVFDQLSISILRLVSTIIRDAITGIQDSRIVSGVESKARSGIGDKSEETDL